MSAAQAAAADRSTTLENGELRDRGRMRRSLPVVRYRYPEPGTTLTGTTARRQPALVATARRRPAWRRRRTSAA